MAPDNHRSGEKAAHLNLQVLAPLCRYILERHGPDALETVAEAAQVTVEQLQRGNHWVSLGQFETILEHGYRLAGDEERFKEACTYDFRKTGFGAFRMVVWALSPKAVYALGAKNGHMISSISHFENTWHGPREFTCRYFSERKESRLSCLSRQAQTAQFPTLWGLPPARLKERSCIANGDDCCEYHVQIHQYLRWVPLVVGLVLGLVIATTAFGISSHVLVMASLVGVLAGLTFELWRTNRANLDFSNELRNAFEQMASESTEARKEILNLTERQTEWTRILEEQVGQRTKALEQVVNRIQRLDDVRTASLQGVSHDLRGPLTYLSLEVNLLREFVPADDEILVDHVRSIEQMEKLLSDLMGIACSESGLIPTSLERVETTGMNDQLKRRISALVYGRDIRTSVCVNREVPESITTDPIIFNRVIDNLLTNAAKYTKRGSIVIELDGKPEFLTIKVSDTGVGIPEEKLQRIFRRARLEVADELQDSYGLGLSVVVTLLDQVGGRIEVMSRVGQGSTFWAHFPVENSNETESAETDEEDLLGRVVTIRRAQS